MVANADGTAGPRADAHGSRASTGSTGRPTASRSPSCPGADGPARRDVVIINVVRRRRGSTSSRSARSPVMAAAARERDRLPRPAVQGRPTRRPASSPSIPMAPGCVSCRHDAAVDARDYMTPACRPMARACLPERLRLSRASTSSTSRPATTSIAPGSGRRSHEPVRLGLLLAGRPLDRLPARTWTTPAVPDRRRARRRLRDRDADRSAHSANRPATSTTLGRRTGSAIVADYDNDKTGRLLPMDGSPGTILSQGDARLRGRPALAP